MLFQQTSHQYIQIGKTIFVDNSDDDVNNVDDDSVENGDSVDNDDFRTRCARCIN